MSRQVVYHLNGYPANQLSEEKLPERKLGYCCKSPMEALSSQDDLARPSGTESRISVFEELPEEAFTVQQTLSFVSPRAFGDNARRVKGVLDDHEVAIRVFLQYLGGQQISVRS